MISETKLPVGMKEIAEILDVKFTTVQKWQQRNLLPPPEPGWIVSGRPAWRKSDIIKWATKTNRLKETNV